MTVVERFNFSDGGGVGEALDSTMRSGIVYYDAAGS